MANVAATFRRPFPEQVAAYRLRLTDLRPTEKWTDLWQDEHNAAVMVAGANKADLLADFATEIGKAIELGTTEKQFRATFEDIVKRNGWTGWKGEGTEKGRAWRARTIYRTNMRTSYMAGRFAQLQKAGFKYWIYFHGGSREPRMQHLGWNGLILEADHPFWKTHYPPNGWGCNCKVVGAISMKQAIRLGGNPSRKLPDGWDQPDPKTGAPAGIDRGWAYAPGGSTARTLNALKDKIVSLPAPISAEMVKSWPDAVFRVWAEAFGEFVDHSLANRVEQKFMIIGALSPDWIRAAAQKGLKVESAEIAITDKGVQHFFRGTGLVTAPTTKDRDVQPKVDPLDVTWIRDLPIHLRRPSAVLLDRTKREPVFALVFQGPSTNMKLVVELNTPLKRADGVLNLLVSGRLISARDLQADLGRGVTVIAGEL